MKELEKILESTVLNEDVKTALSEAWNQKITEARETIAAELREEFASRYDHDKGLIIEASDKFIKEELMREFEEFKQDKKNLSESRVKFEKMKESFVKNANKFLKEALQAELKEFRTERQQVNESILKLQSFVQKQLNEELSEFAIDKKALVESRVQFETTKKEQLNNLKKNFVESAAKVSEKVIRESLKAELSQLKEDLRESKKQIFGKKLFEAFASEFMNSHYNEGSQVKKLSKIIESAKREIETLKESVSEQNTKLTEAKKEVARTHELMERHELMGKLLSPLNKNQRKVMQKLLESTATDKLQDGYKKYISMVLREDSEDLPGSGKVLTESVKSRIAYDGNRMETIEESDETIIRLKTLSGIK